MILKEAGIEVGSRELRANALALWVQRANVPTKPQADHCRKGLWARSPLRKQRLRRNPYRRGRDASHTEGISRNRS